MTNWNARAAGIAAKLRAAGHEFTQEESASSPASLFYRGRRDFLFLDADEGEDEWTLGFAQSYQNFGVDETDELCAVIGEIVRGEILGFAVEVGADKEVCGWCERAYIADIVADYRDDPMCAGGVLVVRAFDGEAEEIPLGAL